MKILTEAPLRISLFGGSTDIDSFYLKHGGLCISMAINLKRQFEIATSEKDLFGETISVKDGLGNFELTVMDEMGFSQREVSVRSISETYQKSGLGSSASAVVALVAGLNKLAGLEMKKKQIAERAWDIEVNKLGLYGGRQDQYAASFGGMNAISFTKEGDIFPYSLDKYVADFWSARLLLFFTGENRKDPKIQEGLRDLTPSKEENLKKILTIAKEALLSIEDLNIEKTAYFMKESWEAKKMSNNVSNGRIDDIYSTGLMNGALSGKCLGAGGGGFMVFLCENDNQKRLKAAMKRKGCTWYDYEVDYTGVTSRILPEERGTNLREH